MHGYRCQICVGFTVATRDSFPWCWHWMWSSEIFLRLVFKLHKIILTQFKNFIERKNIKLSFPHLRATSGPLKRLYTYFTFLQWSCTFFVVYALKIFHAISNLEKSCLYKIFL